ncbi:nuclear transport factor 2 family protein [soil metagenome]
MIPTDILAAAENSLKAAGRGDRSGWVGLFTPDGRVEDPVGSRPHIGPDQIGAFFDTFIGPRQISYRGTADIVSGSTVIRDLTLDVRMGAAVQMAIPAYLRYSVRESGGELKIAELQAYWELPPMIVQFGSHGLRAAAPGLALARGLLANQRLGGSAGLLRGLRRVGGPARRVLDELLGAVSGGDEVTTRRLLGHAAVIVGDALPIGLEQLATRLRGACFANYIAAGPAIAVSVINGAERGVLIADFGRDRSITRLRYFAP